MACSSYTTTLTNVVTSTSTVLSTAATCTPATTTPPSSAQCSNYIWWRSGTWYEEYCTDASVVGGSTATQLSALGQYVNNINQCVQVCGMVPNMCNAINYDPALRTCYFISAAASQTLGSGAGYQAVTWHTTNPCVGTVTASLETAYSTEYVTTEYTTTYTVTISSTPTPAPTTTATPSSVVLPGQSASSARVSTSSAVSVAIPSPSASSISISPSVVSSSVRVSSASIALSSVPSPIQSLTSSSGPVIPPPASSQSASSRPSSSTALVIPSPSSVASSIARSSSIPPHASSSTPIVRASSSIGGITTPSSLAIGSGRPTRRTTTISVTETITSSTTICSSSAATTLPSKPAESAATSTGQAPTSSEVAFTTSTVLTTRTATITACPSSVTNCPARSRTTFLTTETIVVSTTVCPVTETSSPQPTGANAGASAAHGGSPAEEQGFTTSTIFSTRTSTVTACPGSVTDCPARSKTTFLTTETIVASTTICSVTLTGEVTVPTGTGKAATTTATHDSHSAGGQLSHAGEGEGYTTSTIFSTRTATITACPSSVTNCPARAKTTYLTTETLVVSTTICPIAEATSLGVVGQSPSSAGQVPDSHPTGSTRTALDLAQGAGAVTASTRLSTRIATITACPSGQVECDVAAQTTYFTTETLVVPVYATSTGVGTNSVPEGADAIHVHGEGTTLPVATEAGFSAGNNNAASTVEGCSDGQLCSATGTPTTTKTYTLVAVGTAVPVASIGETGVRPGYGMVSNHTNAAMQTASRVVGSSSSVDAASSASTATLAATASTSTKSTSSTSSAVNALFTGGAVAGRAPSSVLGAVAVLVAALIL